MWEMIQMSESAIYRIHGFRLYWNVAGDRMTWEDPGEREH